MYSVPESFLEIEVRNPQTHGKLRSERPQSTILKISFPQVSDERCIQIMKLCARFVSTNALRWPQLQPSFPRPISPHSNCGIPLSDVVTLILKHSVCPFPHPHDHVRTEANAQEISLNVNQPESTSLLFPERFSPTVSRTKLLRAGGKVWRGF